MLDQYGQEAGAEEGEEVEEEEGLYDEEDERGEYAPVVVELTDGQRRMLGVEGDSVITAETRLGAEKGDEDGEEEGAADGVDSADEEEMDLEEMDARY